MPIREDYVFGKEQAVLLYTVLNRSHTIAESKNENQDSQNKKLREFSLFFRKYLSGQFRIKQIRDVFTIIIEIFIGGIQYIRLQ
jgi:hypothetical protein